MSTVKMIIGGISAAVGFALLIAIAIFVWRLKGDIEAGRNAKDSADVQRLQGRIVQLEASVAQKDSIAALTAATFLTARSNFQARPIVTGGGAKADAIANNAVQACFETASKALSACQVARVTADSVPVLKDTISILKQRIAARQNKRWTARGGIFYAWPERAPLLRAETDFRILNSISATAGGEATIIGQARIDSTTERAMRLSPVKTWRVYTGVSIPFR